MIETENTVGSEQSATTEEMERVLAVGELLLTVFPNEGQGLDPTAYQS